MLDALVIGAGPNGLVAAVTLARRGWSVLVLEAQPRPGGALYSLESTLPGYLHDVGAAFFGFSEHSPALRSLDLEGAGVRWANARFESAHPGPDGTCPCIARDLDLAAGTFGEDGPAWRKLVVWQRRMGERLAHALLAPLPALGPAWRLGLTNVVRLGLAGLRSTGGLSRRLFRTPAARRVLPGLALHVDLGPEDLAGAGLGLALALQAADTGFRVPLGGARALTLAMLRRLEEAGGKVRLHTRAERILVEGRRVVAVRTNHGEEIPVRRAVIADTGAPALFLKLLEERHVSWWLRRSMRRFRYGWGTFKMDWALAGPVPWTSPAARAAAVVHAGDSLDDLIAFTRQVRAGELPSNPYLVIGQQSLVDPSRAPPGGQTLWAYSHVPGQLDGGWANQREAFADRVEQRIEGLAPGFRALIRGRAIWSPTDLEAMNENLVGGDLGGGTAAFDHQLFFRPAFPYVRHRTPIRGLYLGSASCHPGAGVHGACGYNAAHAALKDN